MTLDYRREFEIRHRYDVAVIGGGPAGVAAAVEAARNGADTLLAESSGLLGGMAASALVGPFMTCYDRDGERKVVGGIFDEIVERTAALGGAIPPSETDSPSRYTSFISKYHRHVTPFDSFALETALDGMVKEAGVGLMLYTSFCDAVVNEENGKIDALIFSSLEGLWAAQADVVVDCTGTAAVAAAAGAPTWKGGEDGAPPQPGTYFFEVDGANDEGYVARPKAPVKAYMLPGGGAYKINSYRVFGVDAADSASMTEGTVAGRKQVFKALDVLHGTPGFENARLSQAASMLGVRESRHIRGKYILKVSDLTGGTVFDDSICCFGYGMDVHPRDPGLEGKGNFKIEVAPVYTIPYRCLVTETVGNLLAAGKCISAESQAAGSIRVMPACVATGQAAGAAAAMASLSGTSPSRIDTEKLISLLRSHGAVTCPADIAG